MEAAKPEKMVQDFIGTGLNLRLHCCGISIFVLMALLLVSFAYQMHPAHAAQEDKEIIAGVPSNFPPQYQVDAKTGKPYGFAIDVMDDIAHRNGIKVRYVVYGNFSDVMLAMQKGEVDLIPNLGITEQRKNYTDFTAPVETFHIHIFVRSTTDDIKNIDDLTGRKVVVVAGNQGYFIMKEHGGSEMLVYNSMEEALMALISGNADAMVYPEEPLLRVARQWGIEEHIKPVGDALAEIKRAIGVRKGQPELYYKLDEAVKAFILTPEYEKIYSKWYGKPEPYWNTERVLVATGIAIALAAAIFFVFHYFSVLRLNRKLQESEEKYRNLVERSNDGILIIQDGLIKFANVRLAELWGGDLEELLKTPIIHHIHPGERDKVMERYQRRMANEDVPPIYETVLLRKDGTAIHIEINANVIRYKGKLADLVTVRDITERKRAEIELRKSEERYRGTLDNMMEGAQIVGFDWEYLYVNEALVKQGRKTKEELLGHTMMEMYPGIEKTEMFSVLNQCMKNRISRQIESEFTFPDGSKGWFDLIIQPVPEGIVILSLDITERKKAQELRIEKERLEYASKAKSEFLASMSHELRTPLNAVLGFSQMLGSGMAGELNEKQKRFVDNINNSSNFLLNLINDILDLSKIEAGKIELNREKIPLKATVEETITLIKEKAMKHMILLNKDFEPRLDFIEADKQRVKQILFNLLSNAIKFSKVEGGTVTITAKKVDENVQISVSDTGIGIKPENLGKLFQKFEQLDKGISEKYGGTGLGLAITKQLVELHGGSIWAQSKYGEGTTFTFTLPLKATRKKK